MKGNIERVEIAENVHIEAEYISEIYAMDNLCIFVKERMVGRALVIPTEENKAVLLDIYVYNPDQRGKGYGSMLMSFLCRKYNTILTGWMSTEGRDLCLKHGFTLVKGMFAKNKDVLIFQKGANDGRKEDGSAETAGSEGAERKVSKGCQ